MNVDLNWCPCGKQSREDSMYCSDACYLKDLASNGNATFNGFTRYGKKFEKDNFYTSNGIHSHYNEKKGFLKVPDFKNPYDTNILSASTNLAFKNRQKYHQNSYYYKNSYANSAKGLNVLASSFSSTSSTIEDYFKRPNTHSKGESSPKPVTVIIAPKENENAKEKNDVKSCSSRSSYVIEAVYPVHGFKSSIAVY